MKIIFALLAMAISAAAVAADAAVKTDGELAIDSEAICRYESTERGQLNADRLRLCLVNHRNWQEKVTALNAENRESFYVDYAQPYCYKKNTRRGVAHAGHIYLCLESEVNGFKDVEYYINTLGKERVMPIAQKAMSKFGSWAMASYTVKSELNLGP